MTPDQEKKYFEVFRNLHPLLKGGKVITYNGKREWPDVEYCTQDNRLISIEVTELSIMGTDIFYERVQASEEQKLLSKVLQNLNSKTGLIYSMIDILLHPNIRLKKNETDRLAYLISSVIEKSSNNTVIEKHTVIDITSEELTKNNIDRIRLFCSKKLKRFTGNIGDGCMIKEFDAEEIKSIIRKKDEKLIKWNNNIFSENWLLILQTEETLTWRDNIKKIESYRFESVYDKVFIYRYLDNFIYEILLQS
ncbi:MAG: hypothetical protein RBS73_04180 [Prolixibacteraceae bacterium]|nr:hypothetical protein [Prolixibacteraceae bacterium]